MRRTLTALVAGFVGLLSGCVTNGDYFKPFNEVLENIVYRKTVGYVQSPFDTKKKGGDCGDKAILLLDEWRKRGINGRLKAGRIEKNNEGFHVWCEVNYNGKKIVFDPTTGLCVSRETLDKLGLYVEEDLDLDFYKAIDCIRTKR